MIHGKDGDASPPHNDLAERALLGAVLREPSIIANVSVVLRPEHLYSDPHQRIYRAMPDLNRIGKAADLVSVYSMLNDRRQLADVGSEAYLTVLWEQVPTAASWEYHAELVREASEFRSLIHVANEVARDARDRILPAHQLLHEAETKIASIRETGTRRQRFEFIDSADFLAGDYRMEFAVSGVMAMGQPAVIGGPMKTLKTSLLVDLGVSIATGVSFLGKFAVPKRRRVAIVSGESGKYTLKETALRVMNAKGLDRDVVYGWLKWEFTLPTFTDIPMITDFAKRLVDLEVDIVAIDPAYLAMGDVDPKSVFSMGAALRRVGEYLTSRNITPVIVHHANRMLPAGEVMGLEHLSHAGFAEYARQWMLVSRRMKYEEGGRHDLWVSIGGSAGHGGLWALGVDEGVADEEFSGRRWDVTVQTASEVHDERSVQRDEQKRDAKQRQAAHDKHAILLAIDAIVASGLEGATERSIRTKTTFGEPKVKAGLADLEEAGVVEPVEFMLTVGNNGRRKSKGYRRAA